MIEVNNELIAYDSNGIAYPLPYLMNLNEDNSFFWSGTNAELIGSVTRVWTLADTSFEDIRDSISTTAATIKSSESNWFKSPIVTVGDKDVFVIQKSNVIPIYQDGVPDLIREVQHTRININYIPLRNNITTKSRQVLAFSSSNLRYYNNKGVFTQAQSDQGLYLTTVSPGVNSATAEKTYVRCGTPNLYCRVSATIASAETLKQVVDCTFKWTLQAFLVDPLSTIGGKVAAEADSIFDNGLPDVPILVQ